MVHQIIGTRDFIAWFYAIIYMRVVRVCKKYFFVKITIHTIGLIIIIIGLYAFITSILLKLSIYGLFLIFAGIIIFVIPFGVNAELRI